MHGILLRNGYSNKRALEIETAVREILNNSIEFASPAEVGLCLEGGNLTAYITDHNSSFFDSAAHGKKVGDMIKEDAFTAPRLQEENANRGRRSHCGLGCFFALEYSNEMHSYRWQDFDDHCGNETKMTFYKN